VCYEGLEAVADRPGAEPDPRLENQTLIARTRQKSVQKLEKKGGSGANQQHTANRLQPANRDAPHILADRVYVILIMKA
jgi:hypothetical protein